MAPRHDDRSALRCHSRRRCRCATFMAYGLARNLDTRRKDPQFGTGPIRGLAGLEAAGSATRRHRHGCSPGPGSPGPGGADFGDGDDHAGRVPSVRAAAGSAALHRSPELVWGLLASFFIAMIVLLTINLPFAPLWAKLLKIPDPYLDGGIPAFCGLGIYATSASTFKLFVLLAIGIISFVLKRYGVPLAPLMIGMVLGPLAESNLRDELLAAGGDASTLVSSPITIVLCLILIATLIYTGIGRVLARKRSTRDGGPTKGTSEENTLIL